MGRSRDKALEEAIDKLEERYENIESLSEMFGNTFVSVEFHYQGNMKMINKVTKRLFGYKIPYNGDYRHYDGIVKKWEDGERVPRIWFEKESNGVYRFNHEDWRIIYSAIRDFVRVPNEEKEEGKDYVGIRLRKDGGVMDSFNQEVFGDNLEYKPW